MIRSTNLPRHGDSYGLFETTYPFLLVSDNV